MTLRSLPSYLPCLQALLHAPYTATRVYMYRKHFASRLERSSYNLLPFWLHCPTFCILTSFLRLAYCKRRNMGIRSKLRVFQRLFETDSLSRGILITWELTGRTTGVDGRLRRRFLCSPRQPHRLLGPTHEKCRRPSGPPAGHSFTH